MSIRTYIASFLLLSVLALATPIITHAACVNGREVDEFGLDKGACADTTTTTADINFSDTYAFKRQGVFGCSLSGSYSMSVGALSAVGGVYVPVNDAAVTLNTGYLVYKECVLRGVVNRQRETATASLQKQVLNSYTTGRDGNPLYSSNIVGEKIAETDRIYLLNLQNGTLNAVNPAFRPAVTRAIAQGYAAARNAPNKDFECSYKGDMTNFLNGKPDGNFWQAMDASIDPACNPYGAYLIANGSLEASANTGVNNMMTRLQWYNGNYGVQKYDVNGNPIVLTPGSIVGANALQALQTGFTQLQNANDIDQMVGALFAGITSQAIGDNRGLIGLTQTTGSRPSYIDQVVQESAQGLRDTAANAALQILVAAKQIELGYKQAMDGIAGLLSNAIGTLRARENACWALVIEKVCAETPSADKTCTAVGEGGERLKVATSTAFSQPIVNNRIAPLGTTTIANGQRAVAAMSKIDSLIAGVTNSASLDAQRVALQQLDNLVAQRTLHNQYDLQGALKAKDDVQASMDTLLTDTVKTWAESPDPNVGWCNVNNKGVLDFWIAKWKI